MQRLMIKIAATLFMLVSLSAWAQVAAPTQIDSAPGTALSCRSAIPSRADGNSNWHFSFHLHIHTQAHL